VASGIGVHYWQAIYTCRVDRGSESLVHFNQSLELLSASLQRPIPFALS